MKDSALLFVCGGLCGFIVVAICDITWRFDEIGARAVAEFKAEAVAHGAARWTVSAEGEVGFEWLAPKEQP